MPCMTINGTSLYYVVHGEGIPLVFVHPLGLSHQTFFPQLRHFRDMCKVVLVDLRGNGKSGKLDVAVDDVLRTQAEDLKRLLEELDIPKAVFIGVSDGGVLVQKFSFLYPEKVIAMILSDSYCNNTTKGLSGKLRFAVQAASWLTYYLPGELFLRSLKLTYYRWNIAYNVLRYETLNKRPTDWIKQRLAVENIDYRLRIRKIEAPVLCLSGDFAVSSVRHMQEVAGQIPGAAFAIIPDSHDPSNLCQPRQFNEKIERFLESLPKSLFR